MVFKIHLKSHILTLSLALSLSVSPFKPLIYIMEDEKKNRMKYFRHQYTDWVYNMNNDVYKKRRYRHKFE